MKKNGFVFLETVVVVSILSVMLIALYSSYSYILLRAESRDYYNSTDYLYRSYQILQFLDNKGILPEKGFDSTYQESTFGLSIDDTIKKSLSNVYDFGDLYILTPSIYLKDDSHLQELPPSLIDYIYTFSVKDKNQYYIFKYDVSSNKVNPSKYQPYNDGEYPMLHYYVSFKVGEIR